MTSTDGPYQKGKAKSTTSFRIFVIVNFARPKSASCNTLDVTVIYLGPIIIVIFFAFDYYYNI